MDIKYPETSKTNLYLIVFAFMFTIVASLSVLAIKDTTKKSTTKSSLYNKKAVKEAIDNVNAKVGKTRYQSIMSYFWVYVLFILVVKIPRGIRFLDHNWSQFNQFLRILGLKNAKIKQIQDSIEKINKKIDNLTRFFPTKNR